MSVRRADQEDQPSTSALPPTLFRLPDLDRPSSDPETESTRVTADQSDPGLDADPGSSGGSKTNGDSHFVADQEGTDAETAMASSITTDSLIRTGDDQRSDQPADPSPTNHPNASESIVDSRPTRSDSASAEIAAADEPAGRGWMEKFGSNRSIAVMLVLVFIAAWWTSPKFGPSNDSVSDGFANSETALEMGSDEMANSLLEGSLQFDLGERESFVTNETEQEMGDDQTIAQVTPVAPNLVAESFDSSPTTPSGPEVSVAMGTPEPTANFDANLFGDANSASAAQEPPTPPSLSNSRIEAQVAATPTNRDVLGNLEQMARKDDFGVAPNATGTVTANRYSTEPTLPTRPSTQSPLGVDWSRYLPANR